jgi:flagellar basal-body rod protein FlgB
MSSGFGINRTDGALESALTGLSRRQEVISNNIANVDTPGFRASKVTFEDSLKAAMSQSQGQTTPRVMLVRTNPNHIGVTADSTGVEPQMQATADARTRADQNNVNVDSEMINLVDTNVRYDALARVVSSRFSLLHTIVNGGR